MLALTTATGADHGYYMKPKLCCLIDPEVKCKECGETWCESCWFDNFDIGTTHTDASANGGWGICPKVDKRMRWAESDGDDSLQYIEARL